MSDNAKRAPRKGGLPRKIAKIVGIVIGVVVVLLLVAIIIGPHLVPTSAVERMVSRTTQQDLGRSTTIDSASMSLIAGAKLILTNVVIADKKEYGERPLLRVSKVTLDASLLPLLGNRLVVNKLSIEQPQLSLVKGKDGKANILDIPPQKVKKPTPFEKLPSVKITNFSLDNGTVFMTDLATDETTRIEKIDAKLDADLDPSKMRGEIRKATLSFDGFNATATGKAEQQNGKTTVRDAKIDSNLDLTKLGPKLSTMLPVKVTGSSEYHMSANGPLNALETKTSFTLKDFTMSGAKLRKPARIDKFESTQNAVLDLEKMSVPSFQSEVKSESLGIDAKITGKIGSLKEIGPMEIAASGNADLGKLVDFVNSFSPKPIKATGVAVGQTTLTGDPNRELAAKGNAQITDLAFEGPGMPKPYTDERVNLAYDVIVRERKSLTIKQFNLDSRLLNAQASGTVSADVSDLTAKAQADLAAASSLMAGMGFLPEGTSFGGQLTANLSAKNVKGGIQAQFDSTIRNFFLVNPLLVERYTDNEIKLTGSAVAGLANGKLDRISDSKFNLASKLAQLQGQISASQLATVPKWKIDTDVTADLAPIGEMLVAAGFLDKQTALLGKVQGVISLATVEKAGLGDAGTRGRGDAEVGRGGEGKTRGRGDSGTRGQGGVLGSQNSAFSIQHSALSIQDSAFSTQHSALGIQHSGSITHHSSLITSSDMLAIATNDPRALARLGMALPMQVEPGTRPFLPEFIDKIIMTGSAQSNRIGYNRIKFDKTTAKFSLDKRMLKLDGRALLYNGQLDISYQSDMTKPLPSHTVGFKMRDVVINEDVAEVIKQVVPFLSLPLGSIAGKFDADAQLTAEGRDKETFLRSTDGSGNITMPEDARVALPAFLQLPKEMSELKFGRMEGTFAIKDGQMDNQTVFTAPDLVMKMTGTAQLPQPQKIEYHVYLTGERVPRDLKKVLSKNGESPIGIGGTLGQPKPKVFFRSVLGTLQELLK